MINQELAEQEPMGNEKGTSQASRPELAVVQGGRNIEDLPDAQSEAEKEIFALLGDHVTEKTDDEDVNEADFTPSGLNPDGSSPYLNAVGEQLGKSPEVTRNVRNWRRSIGTIPPGKDVAVND